MNWNESGRAGLLAVLFAVVLMMAVGQILFKATAIAWKEHATWMVAPVMIRLLMAGIIYGLATIAWIWVLQAAPLSMAYPVIALTFVLVPLGAHMFFAEPLSLRYLIGTGLIIIGVVVATMSSHSG